MKSFLLVSAVAILMTGGVASAVEPVQPSTRNNIGWKLTTATVVEGGRAHETGQGYYVHDYSVKAAAEATTDATPIKKGWFTFRGTIFSPKIDRPGQKAGFWYLQGGWSITAVDGDPKELKVLHNSSLVEGELRAETTFNPGEQPGAPLEAKVMITNNLAAGRWTNGTGTFTGTADLAGTITMNIEQRPDLTKPKKPGNTK
jgi:hypothetical protein